MDLKQLEEEIDYLKERIANLEREKLNGMIPYGVAVPFEVEVPDDIDDYVHINNFGNIYNLNTLTIVEFEKIYKRGLAFKTKEEAEQHDKERILLFKLHEWADWRNGDWYPNWEDCDDKFYIAYDHGLDWFKVCSNMRVNAFHKLPYFKSEELAREFIEEFGDEIKEVLL